MKQKTIKQTLTTLCILTYLTLSAQVIDRFPHVESFEGSGSFGWGPICAEGSNCGNTPGRFNYNSNFIENMDGETYVNSHQYSSTANDVVISSYNYDFSCLEDASISFWFACENNNKLNLEISINGGVDWIDIWDNGNNSSSTSLSLEEVLLNTYLGNDNVQFRFVADKKSFIDNIKIGPSGNTINLSYNYDQAGNRIGSTLTITLHEEEIVENRSDESNAFSRKPISSLP